MAIKKYEHLNIYYLYTATVLGKKEFTVSELSELFKEDTVEWVKDQKTGIDSKFHKHLSDMCDKQINNTLLITRKENKDVKYHPWTYSIDLDNEIIVDNAKKFLRDFIEKNVEFDVIQLENGHLAPDWIYMEDDMCIQKIKFLI